MAKKFLSAICERCKKEYLYCREDRRKGKYCSVICLNKRYDIDDHFFEGNDVEKIYEIIGLIFSIGRIKSPKDNRFILQTVSEKDLLRFAEYTKSTYKIIKRKLTNKKFKYETLICSKIMIDYLADIGLTNRRNLTMFPTILPEYAKYFLNGYIKSENATIYKKKDHNLIIINENNCHNNW